jgi:hypothetical protein
LPPAAVAADRKARGIDAEFARIRGDPFCGGDRVIGGGGKLVLGREAVIDRDHDQRA